MATRPNLQGLDPKATSSGILNWIMDNGQSSYFAGAPRADETDVSIRALGDYILGYQPRRNDFVHALVNLIGMQLIIATHYTNQWSWALRGTMTAGETIEEVFINPARAETPCCDSGGVSFDQFSEEIRMRDHAGYAYEGVPQLSGCHEPHRQHHQQHVRWFRA